MNIKNIKWSLSIFVLAFAIGGFFIGKNSTQSHRNPSSEKNHAKNINAKIANELKQLKTIKSVDDVKPVITKIIAELKTSNMNGQHKEIESLITGLNLYLEAQGLLDRVTPVLENNTLSSIVGINSLKTIKQNIPESAKEMHALFDYLWIPNENAKTYQTLDQIQNDVLAVFIPKLVTFQKSLAQNLIKYPAEQTPVELFHIDVESLLETSAKFLPETYRVYTISSAHLWALKVEIEKLIAASYYFSAYNLDELGKLSTAASNKASGVLLGDKFTKNSPLEKTNKLGIHYFHEKLNKRKFEQLFTLKSFPNTKEHPLELSKKWLILALESQKQATLSAKQVNPSNQMVQIHDSFIQKHANKHLTFIEEELQNLQSPNEVVFISALDGKTFKIHPALIFDPNFEGIQDLKNFFPTSHDKNTYTQIGTHKVINLNYGKANAWKDPTFGGILPETQNHNLREKTLALTTHPATVFLASWLKIFQ